MKYMSVQACTGLIQYMQCQSGVQSHRCGMLGAEYGKKGGGYYESVSWAPSFTTAISTHTYNLTGS